ncbi:hypothetical protein BVX97_05475, partial [bacterium E08(2017)]
MKGLVSKVRAKKTKTREKQAKKADVEQLPWQHSKYTGLAIGLVLWSLSVCLMLVDYLLAPLPNSDYLLPMYSKAALLLVSIFSAGVGLKIVEPKILRKNSMILLLSIVGFLSLAAVRTALYVNDAFFGFRDELLIFLLPISITPLLITILLGKRTAMVAGFWSSIAIAVLLNNSFQLLMMGIITTLVASEAASAVKTRSKIIRAGVIMIGASKTIFVFAATATNWQTADVQTIAHQAGACLVSGFLSAVATVILLPFLERPFRITSNITLLELADLGHPLLQRLAIEAPGTYHHSLVVANLAQAAADEIGANSLLTRICSYFHDEGKLTKPDFFAENIQQQQNPHDNLPPSMSTLVITANVK